VPVEIDAADAVAVFVMIASHDAADVEAPLPLGECVYVTVALNTDVLAPEAVASHTASIWTIAAEPVVVAAPLAVASQSASTIVDVMVPTETDAPDAVQSHRASIMAEPAVPAVTVAALDVASHTASMMPRFALPIEVDAPDDVTCMVCAEPAVPVDMEAPEPDGE